MSSAGEVIMTTPKRDTKAISQRKRNSTRGGGEVEDPVPRITHPRTKRQTDGGEGWE
jgi:hypothetical protein